MPVLANSAAALDGPVYADVVLPGTGDGISQCRLTAQVTATGGPFVVAAFAEITGFLGLRENGNIGHSVDDTGDQHVYSHLIGDSNFDSDCGVTDSRTSGYVDRNATLAEASLVTFTVEYAGQDGKSYRATASLTGASGTRASASVVEIPARTDPEMTLYTGLFSSDTIANGGTIDLGELDINVRATYVLQPYGSNTGFSVLELSDLTGLATGNVRGSVSFSDPVSASGTKIVELRTTREIMTVRVTPTGLGPFSYKVSMATNDPGNNPFTFALVGTMVDITKPELAMVTPVPTPTALATARPFTFTSTEAGTISTGSFNCSVPSGSRAVAGQNTVSIRTTVLESGVTTINGCSLRVTDASGNESDLLEVPAFVVDDQDPTVSFGTLASVITGPVPLDITFSEPVSGFQAADILVSGGSATSLTGSGRTYQAVITPSATGTVTISVPASVVTDAVGNGNLASATLTTRYDATPPGVSITGAPSMANAPFDIAVDFTEAVGGFEDSDIVVSNGTFARTFTEIAVGGSFGGINGLRGTITPDSDGPVTVSIPAGAVFDEAGNLSTASNVVSVDADLTQPGITIAPFTGPLNGPQTAEITLSEPSTDFTIDDLTLTNATATLSGSGASYTAVLTPLADGPVVLSVAAGVFSDAVGNLNTASNEVSVIYDATAPTVSIAAFTGPLNGDQTAIITLSEPSTDFTIDDLTLTNATATLSGSGTSYTAVLTPIADGLVALSVGAGTFSDAAGNFNTTASNEVSVVYDGTAPTVTLSTTQDSFTDAGVIEISVQFSEDVTGFEPSDVVATNISDIVLTGSGMRYLLTLIATGSGDVEVSVPEAVASDAAGNPNLASSVLSVANMTEEETQELIAQFMLSRANLLISSQPDLTGFLSGRNEPGSFSARASNDGGTFSFASAPVAGRALWMRLNGSWATEASRESQYLFGAAGTHARISPNVLLGAMVEFDHISQNDGPARIKGTGWLAGPYVVAKLPDQPLTFEGRLLYGRTSNEISPFGTYTDRFDTERMLALFKVSGEVEHGATTWIPSLQASYTTDEQKAYTDSLDNLIPEQSISLGQLELGLNFRHDVELGRNGALMEITGGVAGILSSTSGSGNASRVVPEYEGGRAKLMLGARYMLANGSEISADTFYDGVGAPGFEDYGLQARIDLRF